jgi:hypothetical protein
MSSKISIYCADIGSVARKNFAWSGLTFDDQSKCGVSMPALAEAIADDLSAERPVALGFECPLFVPLSARPETLTTGRLGDRNRPWSAGAGCGALATGLVQVVWLLREIRRLAGGTATAFLDWESFARTGTGLFLWEAFVSGKAKREDHVADAEAAVQAFRDTIAQPPVGSAVTCAEETYSLIGAALLRSGWSTDLAILGAPCIVVLAGAGTVVRAGG